MGIFLAVLIFLGFIFLLISISKNRSAPKQPSSNDAVSPSSRANTKEPIVAHVDQNTPELSNLERDLISANKAIRQAALGKVINMQNREALNAVEVSIKRLTGKQHIEFYKPGGMVLIRSGEAYNQILEIAREGRMADDPALIQSLIPRVSILENQDLMTELERVDAKAMAIYQLLGVQMQLKAIVG